MKLISKQLIDKLISDSQYLTTIQELSAKTLVELIEKKGLEDSGEVILLATPKQIEEVLDELIWSYDDQDLESFSFDKFFVLLESAFILAPKALVKKIQEFDEDTFLSAMAQELLVFDLDDLFRRVGRNEQSDLIEKAMSSIYQLEIEGFIIFSKEARNWELLTSIIAELNEDNYSYLARILERLTAITSDYVEESGGLYELLSDREQLLEDVAGEREERRAQQGFVSGAQAKAFFASFKNLSPEKIMAEDKYGWIEKEYLKNNYSLEKMAAAKQGPAESSTFFGELMVLKQNNFELYNQMLAEFSFLANVQVEFGRYQRRELSLEENLNLVRERIRRGIKYLQENEPNLEQLLREHGLVRLFKLGVVVKKRLEKNK